MENKGPDDTLCMYSQDDLNLGIQRMFEGTFSLDMAQAWQVAR